MQALEEKKLKKRYKWNPSVSRVAQDVYINREIIRYKGKRNGVFNGTPIAIETLDAIEVIEDKHEFIKIYLNEDGIEKYNALSSTAQRVLTYIFRKVRFNEDHFTKLNGEIMKETGLTNSVVSTAIKELKDKEWIYESDIIGKYWIDIGLFFKGNREVIIKDFFKLKNIKNDSDDSHGI